MSIQWVLVWCGFIRHWFLYSIYDHKSLQVLTAVHTQGIFLWSSVLCCHRLVARLQALLSQTLSSAFHYCRFSYHLQALFTTLLWNNETLSSTVPSLLRVHPLPQISFTVTLPNDGCLCDACDSRIVRFLNFSHTVICF